MVVSEEQNKVENNSNNNKLYSRELSEFINSQLDLLPNNNQIQRLDSENTIDLSTIIIQDQSTFQRSSMPFSNVVSGASKMKPLVYLQNENSQNENSVATDFPDSESTCDYEELSTTKKRKAATIGDNESRTKRFSTASSASSVEISTSTGRGRGGRRGPRLSSLLNENSQEDLTARFGNKVVQKGTAEYNDRRNKNNDAVKKCRAKLQEKQAEREKRLKELTEENRKLSNTVDSLNKELNVLKGILSNMKPQYSLPTDIEEKIKKLESMILANNNAKI